MARQLVDVRSIMWEDLQDKAKKRLGVITRVGPATGFERDEHLSIGRAGELVLVVHRPVVDAVITGQHSRQQQMRQSTHTPDINRHLLSDAKRRRRLTVDPVRRVMMENLGDTELLQMRQIATDGRRRVVMELTFGVPKVNDAQGRLQ